MARDRTEELRERLDRLDDLYEQLWREFNHQKFGKMLRKMASRTSTKWFLEKPLAKLIGYFIAERGLLGTEKGKKNDLIDIAYNWQKVPRFMRMPIELLEASDEKVVFIARECVVGFDNPDRDLQACRSSLCIDIETVRRWGGKLEVTDNILEGCEVCKFEITKL